MPPPPLVPLPPAPLPPVPVRPAAEEPGWLGTDPCIGVGAPDDPVVAKLEWSIAFWGTCGQAAGGRAQG